MIKSSLCDYNDAYILVSETDMIMIVSPIHNVLNECLYIINAIFW